MSEVSCEYLSDFSPLPHSVLMQCLFVSVFALKHDTLGLLMPPFQLSHVLFHTLIASWSDMLCAANTFNLSGLCSHSPLQRTCSLAIALHTCSHGLGLAEVHVGVDITCNHREIFECVHLKFTVSGWSKQTYKHRYTHTSAMQSR